MLSFPSHLAPPKGGGETFHQGNPLLNKNVQLRNSDLEPQQCRAGLDENTQEAVML